MRIVAFGISLIEQFDEAVKEDLKDGYKVDFVITSYKRLYGPCQRDRR